MVVLVDVSLADIAITLVTLVPFPVPLILVTALTSNNLQISVTLRAGVYTVAGRSVINRCSVWLLMHLGTPSVQKSTPALCTADMLQRVVGIHSPAETLAHCTDLRVAYVTFLPLKLLTFMAEKTAPVLLHESWQRRFNVKVVIRQD